MSVRGVIDWRGWPRKSLAALSCVACLAFAAYPAEAHELEGKTIIVQVNMGQCTSDTRLHFAGGRAFLAVRGTRCSGGARSPGQAAAGAVFKVNGTHREEYACREQGQHVRCTNGTIMHGLGARLFRRDAVDTNVLRLSGPLIELEMSSSYRTTADFGTGRGATSAESTTSYRFEVANGRCRFLGGSVAVRSSAGTSGFRSPPSSCRVAAGRQL